MAKKVYKLEKDQELKITYPLRIDLDQFKEIEGGILKINFPIIIDFTDPERT